MSRWVDRALARSIAGTRGCCTPSPPRQDRVDPELDEDFGVFELGQPRVCEPDELALRLVLDRGRAAPQGGGAARPRRRRPQAWSRPSAWSGSRAWVAVEAFADPVARAPAAAH